MKNKLLILSGLIIIVLTLAITGVAQTGKEKALVGKEMKQSTGKVSEITGEISGISKHYLSVVYDRDLTKGIEYELLLPIDKDMQIKNKKSVSELNVGDTISMQYEENVVTDSKEKQALKRKSRELNFVKAAPPKPADPVE